MIYIYFIISFITLFLSYKKWGCKYDEYDDIFDKLERKETWYIFLLTFFWPIAIPLMLAWKGLNKLFNKYILDK